MTDIEIFDRGVYAYLSEFSTKIVYSTTNKAIKNITKNTNYEDAIPYNFISYYRDPNFEIDMNRAQYTAARFGDLTKVVLKDEGTREAQYVHNFPVNLTYQVDIWATKEVSVQETSIAILQKMEFLSRVMEINMNPEGEPARFHILDIQWVDNSDLEVEDDKGKLYRHTITFTLDARIKLVRELPTTEFCVVPVDIYN